MPRRSSKSNEQQASWLDVSDPPAVPPDEASSYESVASLDGEQEITAEEYLEALDKGPDEEIRLAREPLFSALLKRTLQKTSAGDRVLNDYAEFVAPQLSKELAHHTAKGGDFAEHHRIEGRTRADEYSDDQSLRAHLINGLLPAAQVARTLARWGVPRFEDDWDETTYRLFCAGYTLHDWGKLPRVKAQLAEAGLSHDVSVAPHLAIVEGIVREWCVRLGLDRFLEPLGPLDAHLHDLIGIASNTQRRWGTLRNWSALAGLRAEGRVRELATDLSTFADLIAYVGRTPVKAATHQSIGSLLNRLSYGQARLTYHHIAEVRGVLTNLINNAAMDAFRATDLREPLLYAPSGTVYIERNSALPPPAVSDVAEKTVEKVRGLCQERLAGQLIGFGRDGKGLKWADYYGLFFTPRELAPVVARAAMVRINTGQNNKKEPSAPKRYAKLASGLAPEGLDLDLPGDIWVDRVAELCAALVGLAEDTQPGLDATGIILRELGLADAAETMRTIPALGGTPYPWYWIAGRYRPSMDRLDDTDREQRLQQLAAAVAAHLPDTLASSATGWDELRQYVGEHLRFGGTDAGDLTVRMQKELARYYGARKSGRGATLVCSLCTSSYSVSVQQEAAILFAPQVYTNKQSLHSSKAIRHICAICGLEMMLRQVLMSNSAAVGKRFEGRRIRYLFFYPAYFFTTETLRLFRELHTELRNVSFTRLRTLLVPNEPGNDLRPNLEISTFQHIEDLLLNPTLAAHPDTDRMFRLRYSEDEPITFSFLGIPPAGRDAKDAEAWVQPAFLSLLLPLLVDVKVVASESMLPLFNESDELRETVAFDAAHPFVATLLGGDWRKADTELLGTDGAHPQPLGGSRFNLDQVGPALQRLTAAYLIHLDGNARMGAGGFDYRWQHIPTLARDLATSPLYAFHYLKRWQRRENQESPGPRRASLYLALFDYLHQNQQGVQEMTHARTLTELYRRFYRAERLNSNAILRPISVAARAILDTNPQFFDDDEALREVVRGKLASFIDNVAKRRAVGRLPKGSTQESRAAAIEEFSTYLVDTVYRQAFGGDRAAFRGTQLNLLKNACEVLYLDAWRKERAEEHVEEADAEDPGQMELEL